MKNTPSPLHEIFSPRSVAIIGASRREGTVGHTLFRNVISAEFTGAVYPVNPHWSSIGGVSAYPSIQSLPETPDLAVLIIPASGVAQTLEELGKEGTRGAIVISAGFKEIGGEGVRREVEVISIAKKYGISLLGPNCFGVINTDSSVRLNATFSETLPPVGNIAFVSQSGALGQGILLHARGEGIGFTKFVSVGNRAGVNESDLLLALGEDRETRVILLYLESLAEGRKFLDIASEVTRKKPVLIIKSGRTALGEEAVMSHTGNLARAHSDSLFDAVFDEAGVIRAGSIGELFHMAKVFASCPPPRGVRLAILTNSGGPGILAADAAARGGLVLSRLSPATEREVSRSAPPNSSLRNPVDLTADASPAAYRGVLRSLVADGGVDSLLVIATPTGGTTGKAVAETIIEARKKHEKPIVACLFGLDDLSQEVSHLEARGVPCFTFPEEGAMAISQLSKYSGLQERSKDKPIQFEVDRERVSKILDMARKEGLSALPDYLTRGLLKAYGVRFPPSIEVRDEREALRDATRIGFPLVLKVLSPSILHKTDVGGIELHIGSEVALARALEGMRNNLRKLAPHAQVKGFSLEKEIEGGMEVIMGVKRDPDFGPLILFGMGGVFAETVQDVGFRPAPLTRSSVARLIGSVRASAMLQGLRGDHPRDLRALEETLLRLSQLAMDEASVMELDVNPLMVLPKGKGALAVDSRVILG